LKTVYGSECQITCGTASTTGATARIGDMYWGEDYEARDQEALDTFYDTLSPAELQLIYKHDGIAELMKKAFQHGHAIVESWRDDSDESWKDDLEKSNDCG
jgi:hypothetical protein